MPYSLKYFDSATIEEMEVDDFWFPSDAFDVDFQIFSFDEFPFGSKNWHLVARSALYRGV